MTKRGMKRRLAASWMVGLDAEAIEEAPEDVTVDAARVVRDVGCGGCSRVGDTGNNVARVSDASSFLQIFNHWRCLHAGRH